MDTNQPIDIEKLVKDLKHNTEQMYIKNLELAERNKILALLRKIDQIILGSLNKVEQIADQVANSIITDTYFKSVFIYLIDKHKNWLTPLAVTFGKIKEDLNEDIMHVLYSTKLLLSDQQNTVVQAINEKRNVKKDRLADIYHGHLIPTVCDQIQNTVGIKNFLIHPYFIRGETKGAIVIGLGQEEATLPYWNDLIVRLPEVISIAIDNALLYQRIQENNEQLKELDRLKDEFVSIASHELRTPMTAIKSYLWMAINKPPQPLNEQLKNYLNIAYISTERMIHLVEDMLTVSRIEGKRLEIILNDTEIYPIVKSVHDELMIKAKEKQIDFVINPLSEKIIVKGDKDKLREVVQNIIGNALKFTPAQGKIEISFTKKDSAFTIAIFNSGSFIEKEDIEKLFQKFSQVGHSHAKISEEPGTGLGLYISKQIIQLHKGEISVESERDKGTTFRIILPVT